MSSCRNDSVSPLVSTIPARAAARSASARARVSRLVSMDSSSIRTVRPQMAAALSSSIDSAGSRLRRCRTLTASAAGAPPLSTSARPAGVMRIRSCWASVVRSSTTNSGLPEARATRPASRGPGGPPASRPASDSADSVSSGPRSSRMPRSWRAASITAATACRSVGLVVARISAGYCGHRRVSRRSMARLELSAQCRLSTIRTSSAVVHSDSNTPMSASIRWWTSTGTSSRRPDQAPCPSTRRPSSARAESGECGETPSASQIAPNGLVCSSSPASDARTVMRRALASPAISRTRRVLPIPAPPCTITTPPWPSPAAASQRRTSSSSRSRPTRSGQPTRAASPPCSCKPASLPGHSRPIRRALSAAIIHTADSSRVTPQEAKIRNYYGRSAPGSKRILSGNGVAMEEPRDGWYRIQCLPQLPWRSASR